MVIKTFNNLWGGGGLKVTSNVTKKRQFKRGINTLSNTSYFHER